MNRPGPWTWFNSNPTTREKSHKIGPHSLLLLLHVHFPPMMSLRRAKDPMFRSAKQKDFLFSLPVNRE